MRSKQLDTVYFYATVLIPNLEGDLKLRQSFSTKFIEVYSGLDNDSRRKFSLLVSLLATLSFVYTLKSIGNLNYKRRQNFVGRLFSFPNTRIVAGLTGLKSLCFISYYSMEELWETINYEGPLL